MRELKFRMWIDEEGGKQYKGIHPVAEIQFDDDATYYKGDGLNFWTPNAMVMKYTGMKDNNGKEIYEGDIIRGYWHERINDYDTKLYSDIAKVYWDEDNGLWSVIEWTTTDERYLLYDYCEEVVIIGNIFENIKKS